MYTYITLASAMGNLVHAYIIGIEVFQYNYFGAGTGPVLFTNLNCDGTESSLSDCSYSSYYYGISHSDAGVRCNRVTVTSKSPDGLHNESWKNVCL